MPHTLIFNPGSASLKFELIEVSLDQRRASQAQKLLSASIEEMGDDAKLLVFAGGSTAHTERCEVHTMAEGTRFALQWVSERSSETGVSLSDLAFAGVRVVHGGLRYAHPVGVTAEVLHEIEQLEDLAPLHNKSSLDILSILAEQLPNTPAMVAFDTSFHRTLPELAWRYPIARDVADQYGVRKFGFHGLSHRYMLEQYAHLSGKQPRDLSLVTLHLESGSSATAIHHGESVDNTMGLTPLEGLMMGTRSGNIDPAIIPFLMRKQKVSVDEVMELLNKRSGLLGIAGGSFDTRELVKRSDEHARLAMSMFSYRVRLAVGAYLAALGDADAVIFGGGIGVDTPSVRAEICAGLRGWGMDFDEDLNSRSTSDQICLTRPRSRLKAHVVPVEEGLQIAHECVLEHAKTTSA